MKLKWYITGTKIDASNRKASKLKFNRQWLIFIRDHHCKNNKNIIICTNKQHWSWRDVHPWFHIHFVRRFWYRPRHHRCCSYCCCRNLKTSYIWIERVNVNIKKTIFMVTPAESLTTATLIHKVYSYRKNNESHKKWGKNWESTRTICGDNVDSLMINVTDGCSSILRHILWRFTC